MIGTSDGTACCESSLRTPVHLTLPYRQFECSKPSDPEEERHTAESGCSACCAGCLPPVRTWSQRMRKQRRSQRRSGGTRGTCYDSSHAAVVTCDLFPTKSRPPVGERLVVKSMFPQTRSAPRCCQLIPVSRSKRCTHSISGPIASGSRRSAFALWSGLVVALPPFELQVWHVPSQLCRQAGGDPVPAALES